MFNRLNVALLEGKISQGWPKDIKHDEVNRINELGSLCVWWFSNVKKRKKAVAKTGLCQLSSPFHTTLGK